MRAEAFFCERNIAFIMAEAAFDGDEDGDGNDGGKEE